MSKYGHDSAHNNQFLNASIFNSCTVVCLTKVSKVSEGTAVFGYVQMLNS